MKDVLALAVLMAIALLPACSPQAGDAPAPEVEIPEEVQSRLKTSVKMLGGSLKARLAEELGEHGPVAALSVCSKEAQKLTAEASTEGVLVRRVSLKVRNPADVPTDFERAQLERFGELLGKGELSEGAFETREEGGRTAVYFYKPILVENVCLTCHGPSDTLAPELVARLDELYPNDEATGYAEGDLRGMFSARTYLN